jgi:hypothetical protein
VQTAVNVADVVYHLVAAIALIVGGGWAYLKYIRGRTFVRRLDIRATGTVQKTVRMIRLVVEIDASNVGLRVLEISPAESGLRVYTLSARPEAVEEAAEARWEYVGTWGLFEAQRLLEPGESVRDPHLLEIAGGSFAALKLQTTVSPRGSQRSWQTTEVVILQDPADNES